MKNRQSIILWYENVIRKVNKLSFDTFLKTICAEIKAGAIADPIFICIRCHTSTFMDNESYMFRFRDPWYILFNYGRSLKLTSGLSYPHGFPTYDASLFLL